MEILEVKNPYTSIYFIGFDHKVIDKKFNEFSISINKVIQIGVDSSKTIIAIDTNKSSSDFWNINELKELFKGNFSKPHYFDVYKLSKSNITIGQYYIDNNTVKLYESKIVEIKESIDLENNLFGIITNQVIINLNKVILKKDLYLYQEIKKNGKLIKIAKSKKALSGTPTMPKFKNWENVISFAITPLVIISIFLLRLKLDKSVLSWDTSSLATYTYTMSQSFASMDPSTFLENLRGISPNRAPLLILISWPLLSVTFGLNKLLIFYFFNIFVSIGILILLYFLSTRIYGSRKSHLIFPFIGISLFSSKFFIYVNLEFWTEPLQIFTMGICVLLIYLRLNKEISKNFFIVTYFAATLLVLLSKISLAIFPLLLLIIYTILTFSIKRIETESKLKRIKDFKKINLLILPILMFIFGQGFYWLKYNIESVTQFSRRAAFGDFAEVYGTRGDFVNKVGNWLSLIETYLVDKNLTYYVIFLVTINLIKIFKAYRRDKQMSTNSIFYLFLFCSFVISILVISIQDGLNLRFLSSVFVTFTVLSYMSIRNLALMYKNNIMKLIIVTPILVLGLNNVFSMFGVGLNSFNGSDILEIQKRIDHQKNISEILEATCYSQDNNSSTLVLFDIQELNYNNLNFYSNMSIYPERICLFNYLGFNIDKLNILTNRIDTASEKFLIVYNLEVGEQIPEPKFNNLYINDINKHVMESSNFQLLKVIDDRYSVFSRVE
jgi:hypothetical protein